MANICGARVKRISHSDLIKILMNDSNIKFMPEPLRPLNVFVMPTYCYYIKLCYLLIGYICNIVATNPNIERIIMIKPTDQIITDKQPTIKSFSSFIKKSGCIPESTPRGDSR